MGQNTSGNILGVTWIIWIQALFKGSYSQTIFRVEFDDSPGIELPWRRSALSECSCLEYVEMRSLKIQYFLYLEYDLDHKYNNFLFWPAHTQHKEIQKTLFIYSAVIMNTDEQKKRTKANTQIPLAGGN